MKPQTENQSSICLDCGLDTSKVFGQYYMIHDDLWLKAVPDVDGQLCLDCLSKRLGRPLKDEDFAITPVEMEKRMLAFLENEDGIIDEPKRHRRSSKTMTGIRETYTIVLTRPRDCSSSRLKAYMKEAIEAWSGQYRPPGAEGDDDPGDPLFGWEPNIVIRRKKINEEDK